MASSVTVVEILRRGKGLIDGMERLHSQVTKSPTAMEMALHRDALADEAAIDSIEKTVRKMGTQVSLHVTTARRFYDGMVTLFGEDIVKSSTKL